MKRKPDEPKGSPAWMNTFADLMNLLLCFFVLLFSMSTVDAEKFEKMVASFQNTFSILPNGGSSIGDGTLISSGVSQLEMLDSYYKDKANSETDQETDEENDVDGTDPELVRGIMETDLACVESRHKAKIAVWEKWAELGPAWGMIGTLIGLILMLKNMEDASTIGPAMATALVTTLYGSLLANWLCNPIAGKLKLNNDNEMMMKEISVEGILSIQAGENPRVIEEKLKSFLAPSARNTAQESEAGGEE